MTPQVPDVLRLPIAEILPLRARILRAGLPIDASIYTTDRLPGTVHLGVRDGAGQLIACGSFHREPHLGEAAWRLRGMAVDANVQRGGLGSTILAAAQRELPAIDGVRLFWCNARGTAIGFYERLGWRTVGEPFVEVGIPHTVMFKRV